MRERDSLHRFLFEHHPVRGEIARLNDSWLTVLARRDYPLAVRRLLGEAMAATALLSATIKFTGQLTLQIQAQGPLHLLVVQCSAAGMLRGLARWRAGAGVIQRESAPLATLCGEGRLTVTIDPGEGRDPYQGIVNLDEGTLAQALERYFAQSEQLPSHFLLFADAQQAVGMLLQRLPAEASDRDAWNRIAQLGSTLTTAELAALDDEAILQRLFHEETVRVFVPQPLGFRCSCSRERTASLLRALGQDEVQSLIDEQGQADVSCQFCGLNYVFDAVDAANLFVGADQAQPAPPLTRH